MTLGGEKRALIGKQIVTDLRQKSPINIAFGQRNTNETNSINSQETLPSHLKKNPGMEQLEQKEGYRFYPTDSEILKFLLRFVAKQEMHDAGFLTTNIDVYGQQEPWEIYNQGVPSGGLDDDDDSSYRYFITKKSNRIDHGCFWKQQDEGKLVHYNMHNSKSSTIVIGYKKKMHYEHEDGHWIMKEYQLSMVILLKFEEDRRDYVLCAIKKDTCSPE